LKLVYFDMMISTVAISTSNNIPGEVVHGVIERLPSN